MDIQSVMSNGVPLGRWFGIRVVLHFYFLLFLAFQLFTSEDKEWTAVWLTMLFGAVLLHEFGHSLACRAVGGRADYILLWPLGGLAFCEPPQRPGPQLITTVCGPLVNVVLVVACYMGLRYGVPHLEDNLMARYSVYFLVAGVRINAGLFLFNVLPVFPMDGGRMVQEGLWFVVGYAKSLLIASMIGTVGGIGLIVLGTGMTQISIPLPGWIERIAGEGIYDFGREPSMMLAAIGLMAAITSFQTYRRAQALLR